MSRLQSYDFSQTRDYILCVGLTPCLQRTLIFPKLVPGEVNRATSVVETASGKATNVARVIQALGGKSVMIGFAGGDIGRKFVQHLNIDRLSFSLVETQAATRVCQTLVDEASGTATELVEEAALPEHEERNGLNCLFFDALKFAKLIVISGSPPPGYDPNIYSEMIEEAHKKNCRVILDAQKTPLEKAVSAKPWMIKVNGGELGTTFGHTIDSEKKLKAVADELIGQGIEHLVVTEGAKSVWHFSNDTSAHYEPPKIEAINPIGSGDSMAAGIAHAIFENKPIDAAIKQGIACGAANALTPTAGNIDAETVSRLVAEI